MISTFMLLGMVKGENEELEAMFRSVNYSILANDCVDFAAQSSEVWKSILNLK